MSPEQIIEQLRARFPDARCDIVDLTGTKDHYELHIASEQFRGLSAIAIHRLVYATLGSAVGTSIHALSVKACLPEAWAR
jgi:stress-induced morphogen